MYPLNMCRVCLNREASIDIYLNENGEGKDVEEEIATKLMLCSSIILENDDLKPRRICQTCLQNLNVAYAFRKLCDESNRKLGGCIPITLEEDLQSLLTMNIDVDSHMKNAKTKEELDVSYNLIQVIKEEQTDDDILLVIGEDIYYSDQEVKNEFTADDSTGKTSYPIEQSLAIEFEIPPEQDESILQLQCKYCVLRFQNSLNLKEHIRRKHPKKSHYPCIQCGHYFATSSLRRHHQKTDCKIKTIVMDKALEHTLRVEKKDVDEDGNDIIVIKDDACEADTRTNSEYYCAICQIQHESASDMDLHVETKHRCDGNYHCMRCGQNFATNPSRLRHEASYCLARPDGLTCKRCGHLSESRLEFFEHVKSHKRNFCMECVLKFETWDHLHQHNLLMHPQKGKRFYCRGCDKCFNTKPRRSKHERQCDRLKDGYKCEVCSHVCSDVLTYESHLKEHYERDYCKGCKLRFDSTESYLEHRTMHLRRRSVYKCYGCELQWNRKARRDAHEMWSCKGITNGFKCRECPLRFDRRADYERHMFREHAIRMPQENRNKYKKLEEKYICDYCDKVLMTRPSMCNHIAQHINLRKHLCDVCGKGYNIKAAMEKHHMRHFQQCGCPQCPYVASNKRDLRKHMAFHGKGRPYYCERCGHRTSSRAALTVHFRRTHCSIEAPGIAPSA